MAVTSFMPICDASNAAEAAARIPGSSRVRASGGEPHVRGFGSRPAEHRAVGDPRRTRGSEGGDHYSCSLVNRKHRAHSFRVRLTDKPVVGRDPGELPRGAGLREPRVGMSRGHLGERGHQLSESQAVIGKGATRPPRYDTLEQRVDLDR